MRPVESPSSMISSRACASSSPSPPSWTAATRSASRPRRSASCTSASTACASPSATSAAAVSSFTAGLVIGVLSEDGVQLVFEAAGLNRAVDAALLRRVRLPPPAAGAVGLAGPNCARARCAADRCVALVVERVVRHVVLAHVVPDLVLRPFGERVQLHDRAVVVIDLERGRDADARAEALDRPLEDGLGLLTLEGDRELPCFQLVEKLVGAHAAASTSRLLRAGSRRASSPSSSSERRRWNSVKDSSSSRPSSQPRIRPSTAASSPSLGTRRKTGRAIAGSGPSEPRTKMS